MVTIKDVAKLAGVAISTASNAMNGKYGVKEETKKRVLEAAKRLNYIPNPIAQGLVTNHTKNISLMVSGPSSFNFFSNPVFFEVIKSITSYLNKRGYQSLLNVVSEEDEREEILRIAQSRLSAAMILIGTRRNESELAEILEEISIPSLVVIRGAPSPKISSVSVHNWKCGYMATQFLIEMGHRRIGYIGTLPGVSNAEERLQGYLDALGEAGIPKDASIIIKGDYYQESGFVGIRKIVRETSVRPTAICLGNDLMALGVMEGVEQEGLRIPEDISIIGCDNIPNLHLLKTPLTTIAIPFAEIGRLAVIKILGILEGTDDMPLQTVLEPELRIRNSVKKIDRS